MRKRFLLYLFLLICQHPSAQQRQDSTHSQAKKTVLATAQVGLWGGSFYALNRAWYANYPRAPFHLYNDWLEWQHMDKAGHLWSSYSISEHTSKIWQWAGTNKKKSVWIGGISGVAYLSIVEILDGHSDKWGFSIPDMAANTLGAGVYIAQEMLWADQRIRIKLSYFPVQYGRYQQRGNELFGSGDIEKVLKDYNGQTYWVSANIRSFFPSSTWPSWLNLAIGYGAKTMLGGYGNSWTDASGNLTGAFDVPRLKRFHLSLDMDLTKIKTKSKVLGTLFSLVNVLKIPAPSLELNSQGKIRFHPLFY